MKKTEIKINELPLNFSYIKTDLKSDSPVIKYVSVDKLKTTNRVVMPCFHPISKLINF